MQKKSIIGLVVLVVLLVLASVLYFFNDSFFGTYKTIDGETYKYLPTKAPSKDVFASIPEDAFIVSYSVNKKTENDLYMVKILQNSVKPLLQDKEVENFLRTDLSKLHSLLETFINKSNQDILLALENAGIKIPSTTYLYNLGLRPVFKIAVTDEAKIQQLLEKNLHKTNLNGNVYYRYSLGELLKLVMQDNSAVDFIPSLALVVAIKDGYLTASVDYKDLNSQNLPIALGFEQPSKSYDSAKLFASLKKNNLSTNSNAAWFDIKALLSELLARNKEFMQLTGGSLVDMPEGCASEVVRLVKDYSTIVSTSDVYVESSKADKILLDNRVVWQIDSKEILDKLKSVEGAIPKINAKSVIDVGVGLNVKHLMQITKEVVENLNKGGIETQCAPINDFIAMVKNQSRDIEQGMVALGSLEVFNGMALSVVKMDLTPAYDIELIFALDTNKYDVFANFADFFLNAMGIDIMQSSHSFKDLQDGKIEKLEKDSLLSMLNMQEYKNDIKQLNLVKNGSIVTLGVNTDAIQVVDKQTKFMQMQVNQSSWNELLKSLTSQDTKDGLGLMFDPAVIKGSYEVKSSDTGLELKNIGIYKN